MMLTANDVSQLDQSGTFERVQQTAGLRKNDECDGLAVKTVARPGGQTCTTPTCTQRSADQSQLCRSGRHNRDASLRQALAVGVVHVLSRVPAP